MFATPWNLQEIWGVGNVMHLKLCNYSSCNKCRNQSGKESCAATIESNPRHVFWWNHSPLHFYWYCWDKLYLSTFLTSYGLINCRILTISGLLWFMEPETEVNWRFMALSYSCLFFMFPLKKRKQRALVYSIAGEHLYPNYNLLITIIIFLLLL